MVGLQPVAFYFHWIVEWRIYGCRYINEVIMRTLVKNAGFYFPAWVGCVWEISISLSDTGLISPYAKRWNGPPPVTFLILRDHTTQLHNFSRTIEILWALVQPVWTWFRPDVLTEESPEELWWSERYFLLYISWLFCLGLSSNYPPGGSSLIE